MSAYVTMLNVKQALSVHVAIQRSVSILVMYVHLVAGESLVQSCMTVTVQFFVSFW